MPSTMWMLRCARRASSGSCVTRTTVVPESLICSSRSITWRAIRESRLPVGSSARISAGSPAMARAIATRCCWPPESCDGMCFMREASPTSSSARLMRWWRSGPFMPPIAQRHVDVVVDVEVGNEVEALEDEADLLVADARARIVGETADILAVELVGAGVEGLEQPGDVEEGGLARARRPAHRDELPGVDLEREIAQRVRLDEIGAVDLADILHLEHRKTS